MRRAAWNRQHGGSFLGIVGSRAGRSRSRAGKSSRSPIVLGLAGGEGGDPFGCVLRGSAGSAGDPLADATLGGSGGLLRDRVEALRELLDLLAQLRDLLLVCRLTLADRFQNFLLEVELELL